MIGTTKVRSEGMKIVSLLLVSLGLIACGEGSSGGSTQSPAPSPSGPRIEDFAPLTAADLTQAKQEVESRDLSANEVTLVHIGSYNADWMVNIYRHEVEGSIHYGAIAYPNEMPEARRMVVLTDGLQQSNPSMRVEDMLRWNMSPDNQLTNLVYVIPGFRGRALLFDGQGWTSEGDFCDAYDGAATDTIALVNVIEQEFDDVIVNDYLVMGGSRGGNTALIVANRDERVAMAIATASPVDFYRASVLQNYGSQYRCQFINGKTLEQSRNRILNSSPYHFAMDAHGMLRIHQGQLDRVVPEWNAHDMHRALRQYAKDSQVSVYPGQNHGSLWSDATWQSAVNDNIAEYFDYISRI
jgi:pimeloyl-ACP methyl ester carboxylesterase